MQDTTQATTPAEIKRYQCRHIFTDGHRCGSPCLRHEEFCYYHHTTRRPIENPRERRNRQAQFDLALPEDRAAIQLSIGEVLRRIANNEIDSKRAGLLLYGLQIASLNLPRATAPSTTAPVEEIIADPQLGTLAPKAEVTQQEERKGYVGTLLELLKYDLEEKREPEPQFDPAELAITPLDEPSILPEIQAHEDTIRTHRKLRIRRRALATHSQSNLSPAYEPHPSPSSVPGTKPHARQTFEVAGGRSMRQARQSRPPSSTQPDNQTAQTRLLPASLLLPANKN
jgi:hypothetical protein